MLRTCKPPAYRGVSWYTCLSLCFKITMESREKVKLLLDVQRTGYNDMVTNLMTRFNETMSKIQKLVGDLRVENAFFT